MLTSHRLATRALLGVAALFVATVSAAAVSAEKPPGVGEETAGNNLSIPALFVPAYAGSPSLSLGSCVSTPTDPVATADQPVWYDEVVFTDHDGNVTVTPAGYYFEQKSSATWQAQCNEALGATVLADWGDNLTSKPELQSRQPVRVEMTLYQEAAVGTGYQVYKLTDELDRYATYGTPGGQVADMPVRVHDAGATLTIYNVDTGDYLVPPGTVMSAEVNSMGGVVYGYNWGIKGKKVTSGVYEVTFSTVGTTIVDHLDPDSLRDIQIADDGSSITITLEVTGGNAGNGGGHGDGGGGGDGPGKGKGGW